MLKFWDANMELDINFQVSFILLKKKDYSKDFNLEFYWAFGGSTKNIFYR
jgi:hypothetical protein